MFTLKNNLKITHFALILSFLNFLFFHLSFFKFVSNNLDYNSINGIAIIGSLVVLMLILNAFVFYLLCSISTKVGKTLLIVFFVNAYGTILDESMIGNILNTKYSEASSFFSIKFLLYLVFTGILPSIFIYKTNVIKDTWKRFFSTISLTLIFIAVLVFANASNWLWIDKNSKVLGGLAMP